MKSIIVNNGLKVGSFLIKGLRNVFEYYDDIYKEMDNLGIDYYMYNIVSPRLF